MIILKKLNFSNFLPKSFEENAKAQEDRLTQEVVRILKEKHDAHYSDNTSSNEGPSSGAGDTLSTRPRAPAFRIGSPEGQASLGDARIGGP